jgi:SRSO17 transposase
LQAFANYCSAKGHTFMDRRLFLPEEWASDPDRREEALVPAGVIFRTKPELALEMAASAVSERIPFRWVGGDSIYGNSPNFVQGVWQLVLICCSMSCGISKLMFIVHSGPAKILCPQR